MLSSSPLSASFASRMSAGRGVDAVEQRVRHLESLVRHTAPVGDSFARQLQAGAQLPKPVVAALTPSLSLGANGQLNPPSTLSANAHVFWPHITQAAQQYQVDPALVAAVIQQESGFNPQAHSKAGAQGLMQLMPATAHSLGVSDALDPVQNIAAGTRYLSQQLAEFKGNIPLALAAYNAGSGAVKRHGGVPPYAETQQYVQRILKQYLSTQAT
ncbi:MAG: lytic transglycosylase domain-containing protein [Vampirovibrionales bacterium]